MPATTDWRDARSYDYTAGLDGAGWAWEFLRRNPDYQAEVDQCRQLEAAEAPETAQRKEVASQRWGLSISWSIPTSPPPKRPSSGGLNWTLRSSA